MAQPEFFGCDTETVWAKLQSSVGPRELKVGSRVTLTEYATAVVTGRAMVPSEWSDWLRWIEVLWLQKLDDEQYEKYARSKKPVLEAGDLDTLQKVVSQWNEWSSWFAKAVADAANRVLEDARAGNDMIFGRGADKSVRLVWTYYTCPSSSTQKQIPLFSMSSKLNGCGLALLSWTFPAGPTLLCSLRKRRSRTSRA